MPGDEAQTLLKQYLADHDAPCPVCSYSLRGLLNQRCPECGAALTIEVKGKDSLTSGWLLAAFGWSGLGFSSLWGVGAAFVDSEFMEEPIALVLIVLFSTGCCTLSVLLLRRPAWFFRLRAWRRWLIALVPFALLLGLQAAMLWFPL